MGDSTVFLVQPQTRTGAVLAASLAGSEHLGIAYLAAALRRAGCETSVFDLEGAPERRQDLLDAVGQIQPEVVGLSPASASAHEAMALSREVRARSPRTVIIWGGHLASGLGERLFSLSPDIDIVVTGMAEHLVGSLTRSLALRAAVPLHPQILVSPTSRLEGHHAILQKAPRWTELFPERLASPDSYAGTGARALTSVGCPYDCAFCTTPQFSRRRVERRSVEHVLTELTALHERRRVTQVWFNDDLFVTRQESSRRWVGQFAEALHATLPDLRFRAMVRADTFRGHPELLDELVAAGLNTVFVGIESGDEVGLASLNKRTTVDDNRWVAEELHSRNVVLQAGFIMFSPDDTPASLIRNAEFLQSIAELYRVRPLTRSVSIFPGTSLWHSASPEAIDPSRSSPFLRVPMFSDPIVRHLSIIWEHLESETGEIDARLYQARGHQELSWRGRQIIGAVVLDIFRESVGRVTAGATIPQVVARVLGRMPEVEGAFLSARPAMS